MVLRGLAVENLRATNQRPVGGGVADVEGKLAISRRQR